MIMLTLALFASSCGQGQQEIAAAEPATAGVPVDSVDPWACGTYAKLLLDEEGADLATADPAWLAELRSSLHKVDPDAADAWEQFLQANAEPTSRDSWISHAGELDRLTFELCGLPLLSAPQQVDGGSFECTSFGTDEDCVTSTAETWPCFTLADPSLDPAGVHAWPPALDFYQAIDCGSGEPVAARGQVWTVFDPSTTDASSKFALVED